MVPINDYKNQGFSPIEAAQKFFEETNASAYDIAKQLVDAWQSDILAPGIEKALREVKNSNGKAAFTCSEILKATQKAMSSLAPPNCYYLTVHEGSPSTAYNSNLYAETTSGVRVTNIEREENYNLYIKVKNNTDVDQAVTALFYSYNAVQTNPPPDTLRHVVSVGKGNVPKNNTATIKGDDLFNTSVRAACIYCAVTSSECPGPDISVESTAQQSTLCQVAQYNFSVYNLSVDGTAIAQDFESHLIGEGENTLEVSREPLSALPEHEDIPIIEMDEILDFGLQAADNTNAVPVGKMSINQPKHNSVLSIKAPDNPNKDSAALFVVKHFDKDQNLVGSFSLLVKA